MRFKICSTQPHSASYWSWMWVIKMVWMCPCSIFISTFIYIYITLLLVLMMSRIVFFYLLGVAYLHFLYASFLAKHEYTIYLLHSHPRQETWKSSATLVLACEEKDLQKICRMWCCCIYFHRVYAPLRDGLYLVCVLKWI